jgi:tetratricopeptide (TPR) repeat protein
MKRIIVGLAFLTVLAVSLYWAFLGLYSLLSPYFQRYTSSVLVIFTLLLLIPIAFWLKQIFGPPKKESKLRRISHGTGFTADVIFVHGMDGNAKDTWVTANGKSCWADWLSEDRPDLCVWSFDYPASSSAWLGSAMQLPDRAINFLNHLIGNDFGERPICFITHSLGGLVVKQLLFEARVNSSNINRSIANAVRGVVFIATPHIGSILAAFVYKLRFFTRPTWVISDLTPNHSLQKLNNWYRDHVKKTKTLAFRENEPTLGITTIVDFTSADVGISGVTTINTDSDHISICKPNDKESIVYARTLKFLDEILPKTQQPFNVPYPPNKYFTDREEIMKRLRQGFNEGKSVQSISGIAGIGKTQTAVKYADNYRKEYHAVLWAKAQSPEAIVSDYVAIADLLGLREKDSKDQIVAVNAVKRWLKKNARWLLILDNADDPAVAREYTVTNGKGHVLLTTRAPHTDKAATHNQIEKWEPKHGALFLLRRLGKISDDESLDAAPQDLRKQAEELSKLLDGLPLALDQAAAYIIETPSTLKEYLNLYNANRHKLLSRRGENVNDHPESVTVTFSLSFKEVAANNQATADLLCLCAFLDADDIPEEIFQLGADVIGGSLGSIASSQMELNEAIKEGRRFSLLHRNAEVCTISVHRLVQVVILDEILKSEIRRVWADRAVRAVNKAFPSIEYENWKSCERLIRHVIKIADVIDEYDLVIPESARLLDRAAGYLKERALYTEAERLYKRSITIYEKALGSEHLYVANALNNLALLYFSMEKFDEAERLYKRTLTIYEKELGPNDTHLATALNNLALLYHAQERFPEAERYYRRSLEISEKMLGPENPGVATMLSNLANLYHSQKKYGEAEYHYQRSLTIMLKSHELEHPDVANTLNNLAAHYHEREIYGEAEPLYQRSLAIYEKVLGPEHPTVATALSNLAGLYRTQKRHDEAKQLYERALTIFEKAFGPEHPDAVNTRDILGELRTA